jgi:hypothetical protein
MKKIAVSFGVIIGAVVLFFVLSKIQNEIDGEIQIILLDEQRNVIFDETLEFEEEDSLLGLLQENHIVYCGNHQYQPDETCETTFLNGRVLLGIDAVQTDWFTTYIGIYINGDYSNKGIDAIPLNDGDVILFEYKIVGEEN